MVNSKEKVINKPEEKKCNSTLMVDKESTKTSKDSTLSQKNSVDLDYLDWIIDKGWLRTKK